MEKLGNHSTNQSKSTTVGYFRSTFLRIPERWPVDHPIPLRNYGTHYSGRSHDIHSVVVEMSAVFGIRGMAIRGLAIVKHFLRLQQTTVSKFTGITVTHITIITNTIPHPHFLLT
jgi:hypothetical protein